MSEEYAVQKVLAGYVRAADRRDGEAMARLFTNTGKVSFFYNAEGVSRAQGELSGRDAIACAVVNLMKPHPARGWSHHTTHDPIIEIAGDTATIDAQFIVYAVVGDEEPESGWPAGAFGAQGTIKPIESGYYRPTLRKTDGRWLIKVMRIIHDLPMVL